VDDSSSSIVINLVLSLYNEIASPVDVGGFPNHVKYCVSVFSLQWANIRTSLVAIPYNWYQSIWFKVVFDFCSKIKVFTMVF